MKQFLKIKHFNLTMEVILQEESKEGKLNATDVEEQITITLNAISRKQMSFMWKEGTHNSGMKKQSKTTKKAGTTGKSSTV